MVSDVNQLIMEDLKGDGFSPVPTNTLNTNWPKVMASTDNKFTKTVTELANQWQVDGALDMNTPIIQFNFFAPLDNYAGEVKKMDGEISWEGDQLLSGKFKVSTKDVTMGEATYDKNVHKKYLKVFRFPLASFKFQNAIVPISEIKNGPVKAFDIEGSFTMMKKSYPVIVKASLEPFTSETGETKLLLNVNFDVNIFEKFNINGPDGPEDA